MTVGVYEIRRQHVALIYHQKRSPVGSSLVLMVFLHERRLQTESAAELVSSFHDVWFTLAHTSPVDGCERQQARGAWVAACGAVGGRQTNGGGIARCRAVAHPLMKTSYYIWCGSLAETSTLCNAKGAVGVLFCFTFELFRLEHFRRCLELHSIFC